MAAKKATKAAVTEEVVEVAEVEEAPTPKQVINASISRFLEETEIGTQKARYKAMRAIAYQAFVEAIEDDEFEGLVDRAIANVGDLPFGWEIETPAKDEEKAPAKKAPAKRATKAPAKAPAKAAAPKTPTKRTPRRRPAAK